LGELSLLAQTCQHNTETIAPYLNSTNLELVLTALLFVTLRSIWDFLTWVKVQILQTKFYLSTIQKYLKFLKLL